MAPQQLNAHNIFERLLRTLENFTLEPLGYNFQKRAMPFQS